MEEFVRGSENITQLTGKRCNNGNDDLDSQRKEKLEKKKIKQKDEKKVKEKCKRKRKGQTWK